MALHAVALILPDKVEEGVSEFSTSPFIPSP